ncbi:MAG: dTMP kinase [Candidatus Euphemobacter frigidus]|nr:dTMP kinase [Candidatus Euphemobacter frigidus]MDP8275656.1 dTMP kinase [Candidatus Euphemobacter frigidus]
MKGVFITFEGGEGSGKSTQARLLAGYLKQEGYDVVGTREPGGTGIGDAIRAILLDPELSEMGNITELLLLAASRAQNVYERIKPALSRGAVVICDRFIDSTLAYQGYGRNFDLKLLKSLNRLATGGVTPDLTILLDLPPEIGLERSKVLDKAEAKKGEGDRFEQEDIEFHLRLREGFLKLAEAEPERFRKITIQEDVETTHKLIVEIVKEFLKSHALG